MNTRALTLFLVLATGVLALPREAASQQGGLSSILSKLEKLEARLNQIEQKRSVDIARLDERIEAVTVAAPDLQVRDLIQTLEPRLASLESDREIQASSPDALGEAALLAELSSELQQLVVQVGALARAQEAAPEGGTSGLDQESGHHGSGPDQGSAKGGDVDVVVETPAPPPTPDPVKPADAPKLAPAEWSVSAFMHFQAATSTAEDGLGSGFRIRRARFTVAGKFNQYVSGKIQPDFGDGKLALMDAFVKLSTGSKAFNVTMGQFKKPFDIFFLVSATKAEVVEAAGDISGLSTCAGIGGTCAFSRLTGKLGYAGRDVGVQVDGKLDGGRIAYAASLTNGAGANAAETTDAKVATGRLTYQLANGARVSGNVASAEYAGPDGPASAKAYGVDVEVGTLGKPGLHAQASYTLGDNWKVLGQGGAPARFRTAQVIAGYRFPVGRNTGFLESLQPLARVSWGDPDEAEARDGGILLTPGVIVHLAGGNNIAMNIDRWSPEGGDSAWSLKIQAYLSLDGLTSR